jgi:hypothetical protein
MAPGVRLLFFLIWIGICYLNYVGAHYVDRVGVIWSFNQMWPYGLTLWWGLAAALPPRQGGRQAVVALMAVCAGIVVFAYFFADRDVITGAPYLTGSETLVIVGCVAFAKATLLAGWKFAPDKWKTPHWKPIALRDRCRAAVVG